MAENGPGKAERRRQAGRTSLVERAAERMKAGGSSSAASPAELPEPSMSPPRSLTIEDDLAAASALEPGPAWSPDEAIGQALRQSPAPESGSGAGEMPEPEPGLELRPCRQAPMAHIDCGDLLSRGLVTPDAKRNRTVEEFRLIKRVVLSRRWDIQGPPGNTVVVTSALPAEGKTTTAINLAMSIAAEEDVRVVLVDADFIKPDALRQLGVSADKGLVDVLQDTGMDIGDVLLRTNIDRLSLIPAGQLHERCTELLASARMDSLVKELSSRYEDRIVIFDSPPILATTESVALTSHVGQVVFVVQAGRTKRESVNNALELIGERPHVGLVLNRTTGGFGATEFGAYYGSYYYGYRAKEEQVEQATG